MKKLHFFPALLFFILCANGLLAQEKPNVGQSDLEIEKLTRQKDYLRTRIYEIVRENKMLEEKIKLFEDKANTYDDVVANDQKMISELKVAYDQLQHDMKALQEENNSLLTSLEDKESFIQNTQENAEKEMLAAKKQLSAELERKNQNLEAVQNQLKKSQESLSQIQTQYNFAQEALANIQKAKEAIDEKNKFYVSKIVELEESNKKETSRYEEQIKKVTFKKDALNNTAGELSQEDKILKDQILKLTSQMVKVESDQKSNKDRRGVLIEIESLKDKLQQTKSKLQHSEERFQHRESRFSQATAEELSMSQSWKDLEERNKLSEKQNADLIADKNGKKENTAQSDKYKVLKKRFDQLVREGNHLIQGLDTLKVKNRDLGEQNTALMTEKKNKEASLSELTKNKGSLTQELASFSERYKTLEEKFDRISQSAVKNDQLIVKEVEKARKPLEELNANLEKRVAELTAIVEKEGQNISELVEKRRDTEIINRSLTNENKKISEKLVSLEQQLKSVQESFDVKMAEVKTPLDGKILFLEEKLKKMDANDEVISRISKENDQLHAELKSLQDENKKLNSDLAAVNDLLHETDGFLAQKVEEAVIQKNAEIKQLREKLGMMEEQGKTADDVSLKDNLN